MEKDTAVTVEDIDHMLDEIEQNEEKTSAVNQKDNANTANWDEILTQLQNGNSNFVKGLITSKDIDINEQDPRNGKTLLIYVTIIGNYDLVKLVCNFGANVHIKDSDNLDALDYSKRYGRYAITELLFYRQLSGTLGNDLKEIATAIYDKNEEAKLLKANDTEGYDGGEYSMRIYDNIIRAMIKAIQKRDPFSPDLLYYAWYFYLIKCKDSNQDPLTTEEPQYEDVTDDGYYRDQWEEQEAQRKRREKNDNVLLTLWRVMMMSYESILKDTKDKTGWEWLKKYFIPSLIWYLPHPNNTKKDDDDDMDYILQQTLFHELLTRVRAESKVQSDLLLKAKIDKIQSAKPEQWKALTTYQYTSKSAGARQDVCGCIEPKYKKEDLNEELYPPSTHFSAQKHYDTNIYLNELLFRANIIDTVFQFDMKKITHEINLETGFDAGFRAGPIKTLTRSQAKVDNDYIDAAYPTAAQILDLNRCAIQFKSIDQMMKYIQAFTEKIENKKAYSILEIIRCKNGWSSYNPQQPAYTDVKFNVLVQSRDGTIVAEIQLLLRLMSSFKKKAHKLYSVERKFELVYNFNLLQRKMANFKDIDDHENLMIDLIQKNEIESFKTLWLTITNEDNLTQSINALLPSGNIEEGKNDPWKVPFFYLIMLEQQNDIFNFLLERYSYVLCKVLEAYLKKYVDIGYKSFFDGIKDPNKRYKSGDIDTKDELVLRFIKRIYEFAAVSYPDTQSQELAYFFTILDKKNASITSCIARIGTISWETEFCSQSFKYIIQNPAINADDKYKIFCSNTDTMTAALKHKYLDHIWEILSYFNSCNDKEAFIQILEYTPKQDSAKTGFLWICSNATDKRSLLPFILNNTMDWYKLISLTHNTIYTAIEQSLKSSAFNTQMILNYIQDIGTIMSWISEDCCTKLKLNSESVLILLKLVRNDKDILIRLLGTFGLFAQMLKYNRVNVLEYILYETCLTSTDIIGFINNKCHFDYPEEKAKGAKKFSTELIRYFKNDKESLVQILEMVYENRSLFKMLYAKWAPNETRQLLFNDSVLTPDVIYDFLKRNEKGVGVGDHDHDFGPKKETTFFKLVQGYHGHKNTVDLMNYLPLKYVVDLLLQQHTEEKKPYIAKFEYGESLQYIYSKLNDTAAIARLLKEINTEIPAQRQIASQYERYLKFCDDDYSVNPTADTEIKEDIFKDIDIIDNPLRTAIICGNHEIIQSFLNSYVWNKDGQKLFNILNKPKLIHTLFCNENKNEVKIKILRILILDNECLSEQQKFDIINTVTPVNDENRKNLEINITPSFILTNNALRSQVLNYFEKKALKKYVLALLQETISYRANRNILNLSPIRGICKKYVDNIPPIDFIINSSLLTEDEKVKLLDESFVDIVKLNKGLSLSILKFIGNDEKTLMHLLSKTNDKTSETVVMLMMKTLTENSTANESESLMYILDNKSLSYEYKRKLVFEDKFVFNKDDANSSDYWGYGPYQYVFALSGKSYHDTKYIEKIFEYFDVEKDAIFDDCDDILIKVETADHLTVALKNIKDNELLRKLFSVKSKDVNIYGKTAYESCMKYAPSSSFGDDNEPKENRNLHKFQLIQKYQDYLKLDTSLNDEEKNMNIAFNEYTEYWTNPWITCCEFGKMETILKLINYVAQTDDNKYTQLKALLNYNSDLLNGNDWMMTLFENGYKEMIVPILQEIENVVKDKFEDVLTSVLVNKNWVMHKTFLMRICESADNKSLIEVMLKMVKEKENIGHILNIKDGKDSTGNTCLEYAEETIKMSFKNIRNEFEMK